MTILVFGVVILVLGGWGIWYWEYVEEQTLHLQERNFRALTVTSQALAGMVANYEKVLKSVLDGEPLCKGVFCSEEDRRKVYAEAVQELGVFKDVTVAKTDYEDVGLTVKFVREDGASFMRLKYIHETQTKTRKTRWKTEAIVDIGTVMRPMVTEDIFSDVLLADSMGKVLYHQPSRGDPSGFEFGNVSSLLHRRNDLESKDGGAEKFGVEGKEDWGAILPLFNETRIGGIPYTIYSQAAVLPARRGTTQTLILVGIVPAGQFHAEARAIPLNYFLLLVGILLAVFLALPYVKLRTNWTLQRMTPITVTVLLIVTFLGIALLTIGLASVMAYQNMEQHLDGQLERVSEDIRKRVRHNVDQDLRQLIAFDHFCNTKGSKCKAELEKHEPGKRHWAQHLCVGMSEKGGEKGLMYFSAADQCVRDKDMGNNDIEVVDPTVNTMLWIGENGEPKALWSREPYPWKSPKLRERKYVSRILEDETFRGAIKKEPKVKFWIEPIFSWTTGDNSTVLSMESAVGQSSEKRNLDGPIVAALEVKLSSLTDVGVPPGMGFAVIDQEGQVLFHSDSRRNLRENLFEETNRDGRLRQAVFTRATIQFDGRYWGKDRHFQIAPLFPARINEPGIGQRFGPIIESPDVRWSMVTYWDTDMLRLLNLHALYFSGALFLVYMAGVLAIGVLGWWISLNLSEGPYRWVWPQSEHLLNNANVIWLLVGSLVGVGAWYMRPNSHLAMLFWGVLPALVAVVLWIFPTKADHANKNKTSVSARRRYNGSYALVVTTALFAGVVMPALVSFRVAVDVEWRLLAKFSQYDFDRDLAHQVQAVRKFHHASLYDTTSSEVRAQFLPKLLDQHYMYADFPFESCWAGSKISGEEAESCPPKRWDRTLSSRDAVPQWDERLIRTLYQIIGVPRTGHSGIKTDMFLEVHEQWQEPERETRWTNHSSQGTNTPITLYSQISPPIPQWLYPLLVFGSLFLLMAFWFKKTHVFAAAACVVAGFWLFESSGQAFVVLGVYAVFYGACYVLPRFAAQRVLLLDFPHPTTGSLATDKSQGIVGMAKNSKPPDGCSPDSWEVFVKEMAPLRDVLRLVDEPTFCEKILKQDIKDDCDIMKERIIRKILEAAREYYVQLWEKCTGPQRWSLFNLARDGFLHTRNPNIEPLLKSGLIVGGLILSPMNESFRRFIITTGLKERLEEDIVQEKANPWYRVVRPIGAGLLLVMVFLVLTQEEYRTITLAFLGVLPGLLGAFSQALTSSKKEKPETAASA